MHRSESESERRWSRRTGCCVRCPCWPPPPPPPPTPLLPVPVSPQSSVRCFPDSARVPSCLRSCVGGPSARASNACADGSCAASPCAAAARRLEERVGRGTGTSTPKQQWGDAPRTSGAVDGGAGRGGRGRWIRRVLLLQAGGRCSSVQQPCVSFVFVLCLCLCVLCPPALASPFGRGTLLCARLRV